MRRALVGFFVVASISVFACQEDEARPPPGGGLGNAVGVGAGSGGGGAGDGGGGDGSTAVDGGGDSGAVCTTLANDGNVVEQNRIVQDPPPPTGGTIPNGTYVLTQADIYVGFAGAGGPSGVSYRGAFRLTNTDAIERVMERTASQGAQPVESRTAGTLTAGNGGNFIVAQSCPSALQDEYTYSVVNNTTVTIIGRFTKESYTFTAR